MGNDRDNHPDWVIRWKESEVKWMVWENERIMNREWLSSDCLEEWVKKGVILLLFFNYNYECDDWIVWLVFLARSIIQLEKMRMKEMRLGWNETRLRNEWKWNPKICVSWWVMMTIEARRIFFDDVNDLCCLYLGDTDSKWMDGRRMSCLQLIQLTGHWI